MSQGKGWSTVLLEAAENVRATVRKTLLNRNTMEFQQLKKELDREAQQAIYQTLIENGKPVKVISEEGNYQLGEGGPTLILDPVDGTTNLAKGIPLAVTSLAISETSMLSGVTTSVVMDLYSGEIFRSEKNRGTWRGGRKIYTPGPKLIDDMLLSVDISKGTPIDPLKELIPKARYLRQLGCSALALCYVASGLIDAHVDIRGSLRATDIAAALPIIKEAGGIISINGEIGGDLELTKESTLKLIAATNHGTMEEVLNLL